MKKIIKGVSIVSLAITFLFFSNIDNKKDEYSVFNLGALLNIASATQEWWDDGECDEVVGNYTNYVNVFGRLCYDPDGELCGMEQYCTFQMHSNCEATMCVTFV